VKVDGACHCGEIAFEAEVDPASLVICHCTDCQSLSGSAYRANIPAPAGDFRLLRGEPRVYVKTGDSGTKRAQAFCGSCGTQLYACAPTDPTIYSLRVGTIRQRAEFAPARQIWFGSALPWSTNLEHLPSVDGQP
jgi:hypothetical protein